MHCPEARSFLHPWLDGELAAPSRQGVIEHLEGCTSCRDRFEDEKRLLERVRTGLGERCPDALKAKLLAACAAPAPASPAAPATPIVLASAARRRSFTPLRAAACIAVAGLLFFGVDPICLFGCPTVKALVEESKKRVASDDLPVPGEDGIWRTPRDIAKELGNVASDSEVPCLCDRPDLKCKGAARVRCCKQGCMVVFADGKKEWYSFVKARAHLHPWLVVHATDEGYIICTQSGCRFVGWEDKDGAICCFIADEAKVSQDELMACARDTRGSRH